MVYKNVKCPICGARAPHEEGPNEGEFAVYDDSGCYDPLVKQYRCSADPNHLFYISS
jgi:hypothetical protein